MRGSLLQLRLRRAGGKATLDDTCVWRYVLVYDTTVGTHNRLKPSVYLVVVAGVAFRSIQTSKASRRCRISIRS